MNRHIISMLAAVGLLTACSAQQPPATATVPTPVAPAAVVATASDGQLAEIQKRLEAKFTGAPLKGLRAAPIPGLYEVMIGRDIIYFDEHINYYLVGGQLIDIAKQANLTADRASELTAINVAELPIKDAIKQVKGNGERVMYVFTDADCPFCVRLEQTIQQMDNVTVYNFMFPIDSLHPDAARKQRVIWCSSDPAQAWEDYMLKRKLVDGKGDCENPVARTQALGQSLGISGTPAFYLADGRLISGAIPRDKLEAALNEAQAKVAKK